MQIKAAQALLEAEISKNYRDAPTDSVAFPALRLLEKITRKSKEWLLAHPEHTLTKNQRGKLESFTKQIKKKRPFRYMLGYTEFFGHEFFVNEDVLIPRPETEPLVETALKWLRARKHNNTEPLLVTDVGTGSGCIMISVAFEVLKSPQDYPKQISFMGTDISTKALKIARHNAKHILGKNAQQIEFVCVDLLPPGSRPDLVLSNPPYLTAKQLSDLPKEIYDYEPKLALDGGVDGMTFYRRMFPRLDLGIFEVPPELREQTLKLASKSRLDLKFVSPYVAIVNRKS